MEFWSSLLSASAGRKHENERKTHTMHVWGWSELSHQVTKYCPPQMGHKWSTNHKALCSLCNAYGFWLDRWNSKIWGLGVEEIWGLHSPDSLSLFSSQTFLGMVWFIQILQNAFESHLYVTCLEPRISSDPHQCLPYAAHISCKWELSRGFS